MFVYVPIGYYNDPEDIIDLYPGGPFKGDEADIIVNYMLDGLGNFHSVPEGPRDPESFLTPRDASEDTRVVFASNGQYIVSFCSGSYELLRKKSDMHGFFIDIYRLEDRPDFDEYLREIEREYSEPDIKAMTTKELQEYVQGLVKKTKEAILELNSRK